jgi:CSLREA domain-containing protein
MARFSWRKWFGFETKLNRRERLRRPGRPRVEQFEDRLAPSVNPLLVTTLSDASSQSNISLRDAIAAANPGDTIQFQAGLSGTIDLSTSEGGQGTLTLSNNVTIDGTGASITIEGGNTAGSSSNAEPFVVNNGVTAVLNDLTISNGYGSNGGGVYNNGGTLTVSNSTITSCTASGDGGGIYSWSTLTVSNSTFTNNSASVWGGGIYSSYVLTVSNSTFTGNSATYLGGGVYNGDAQVLSSVSNSTFASNTASYSGGGVYNSGTLQVSGSTFANNTASSAGGGITNGSASFPGVLSLSNSTLAGNTAALGGGIENPGTLSVTNSTVAGNAATSSGGLYGGGIDNNNGTLTLANTIVSDSLNGAVDLYNGGTISSAQNSLVQSVSGSGVQNGVNGNIVGKDPLLSALGNYGGPTQTMALLPGSPAIDAGSNSAAAGLTTDQRGVARVINGTVDIGAFESQGFTLSAISGSGQSAQAGTAFAQPLVVTASSAYGEPVAGGQVTFTAPASGASASLSGTPATIGANGQASVTATANGVVGQSYTVTASAAGAGAAGFTLSNSEAPSLVVTTTADDTNPYDGQTSLREALAYADTLPGPSTITFAPGLTGTITLTGGVLTLSDTQGTMTIQGPGAGLLTIDGNNTTEVFQVSRGVSAVLDSLTIAHGKADGGGILNFGTLTVSNSVLANNLAVRYGAGAIWNNGTLTVSNSTLANNSAPNDGGGILNYGTLTVNNSTFANNTGVYYGGAIINSGTATVSDSTFEGNSATSLSAGGAISNFASLSVTNDTFANNSASYGGGIYNGSALSLANTILANNTGIDLFNYGTISTAQSNLIGSQAGTSIQNGVNGNMLGANPLLAPLGNYGGPTQTMALLPGSPAIDAGSNAAASGLTTDQRGIARVVNGTADIGAFESQGFTLSATGGSGQSAQVGTAFGQPLVVTASSAYREPVAGGQVTFTAPASGASASLSGTPATIGANGQASVSATANGVVGQNYSVAASTAGASAAGFTLSNSEAPSLVVTTTADESNPYDGQTSLREALAYANSAASGSNPTITFAPGLSGTIALTGGQLEVSRTGDPTTNTVTIDASGHAIAIDGGGTTRVFQVDSGVTAALTGLTIAHGSAPGGGGILNYGTLTVSGSTFSGDSASAGGGILNYGALTVVGSTFSDDSATPDSGGGLYNNLGGTAMISDSTFSRDSAGKGGGIFNYSTLTVLDSTLSGNSAGVYNGGSGFGGGIENWGNLVLGGSIVAGNAAAYSGSDIGGNSYADNGYNLVGGAPLLAPLGNYGGPTQTMALLPGSPALDAGSPSDTSADQRGVGVQNGRRDIGAFESRGFTFSATSGGGQSTPVGTAFAEPLVVTASSAYGEPVAGGQVSFTAPASGASAGLSGTPATIGANGQASVTATANGVIGQNYTVMASAAGAAAVGLTLSNSEAPSLVVTTTADESNPYDGHTSLREALAYANTLSGPSTITFAPGLTGAITLGSTLGVAGNVAIAGPGSGLLTISGNNSVQVFNISSGANATLSGLTIANGHGGFGGDIANEGTLAVNNDTISAGSATFGAGIFNSPGSTLSLNNDTVSGNTATNNGGGVFNQASAGATTISNSTISGNSAVYNAGIGSGGTLIIINSTISGNTASYSGGGIGNSGPLTVISCTITGNSAPGVASGIDSRSAMAVQDTIIAGNTGAQDFSQGGSLTDHGYNLIGNGGAEWTGPRDILNPSGSLGLSALQNNGGPTRTIALLPGSPALDAGNNVLAVDARGNGLSTDQRGFARIVNGTVDIGAFEVQTTSTAPAAQVATEGAAGSFALGSFADANPQANSWTVDVAWGDNSSDTALTAASPGSLGSATHTYAEEGTYTVSVTVRDNNGDTSRASFLVTVADAALHGSATPVSAVEGQPVTNVQVASFTDDNPNGVAGDFTATIIWGDGDTSVGSVSASGGGFVITGTKPHPYAEQGPFTVGVLLHDAGGATTDLVQLGSTPTRTLGGLYDIYGVAADNGGNVYVAESIPGRVAVFPAGSTTATRYLTGISTPTSPMVDSAGDVVVASGFSRTVGVFMAGASTPSYFLNGISSPSGMAIDPHGNFFIGDYASNYVAEYAPGSPTPMATFGVDGPGAVVFDAQGNLWVTTRDNTVREFAAGTLTPATVLTGFTGSLGLAADRHGDLFVSDGGANAVLEFAPGSTTPTATLTGVSSPGTPLLDQAGDVIVPNGNGTVSEFAPGRLTPTDTVSGLNRPIGYALDAQGDLFVSNYGSATVSEFVPGPVPTILGTATVGDAVLTGGGTATAGGTEAGVNSSVLSGATFTDANPGDHSADFTATINWGDGSPTSTGSVSYNGGVYTVSGAHTYAEDGNHPISITVTDNGGQTTSITGTATVADAALTAGALTPPATTEGAAFSNATVFHFTDTDPGAAVGDYTATVSLGDGNVVTLTSTPGANGQIVANSAGGCDVQLSYAYAEELANGTFAVTVLDAGGASTGQSTATFPVADAPLAATGQAVTPITGTAFSGVVATFTDPGPIDTAIDYTGTITWGDGHTSAGTVAANSQGGFSVVGANTYAADGTYPIAVTINDAGGSSASVSATAYVGGLVSRLSVSAATTTLTAGAPFAVTVKALDAAGNPAYSYAGAVHFTSTDARAVLPANYAFTPADRGTRVFGAVLKTAGTQTITATDTAKSTITGKQAGLVVSPGAVSQFKVVSSATAVTAGTALTFTVTALDAYGNTATGYRGTVHFTSTDAQAALPANYAFAAGDAGTHTFSVTLKTASSQSVTVTDAANGTVTGKQAGLVVSPGAVSQFKVASSATAVTAGAALTFTVTAQDAYGNTVTGYRGTVHLTSTDGQAVLPANYAFTAGDAGRHTFGVTLKTAGKQTVTATDTASSALIGTSAAVTVNPAAATHFSVSAPAAVSKGVAFSFTVTALDAFGNVATGYVGTVTFASGDTKAKLPANVAFTAANAGVGSFTATLNTAGVESLTATDKAKNITGTDGSIQVS